MITGLFVAKELFDIVEAQITSDNINTEGSWYDRVHMDIQDKFDKLGDEYQENFNKEVVAIALKYEPTYYSSCFSDDEIDDEEMELEVEKRLIKSISKSFSEYLI